MSFFDKIFKCKPQCINENINSLNTRGTSHTPGKIGNIANLPDGRLKILHRYLCEHYLGDIPEDIFFRDEDKDGYIYLTANEYESIKAKNKIRIQNQRLLEKCCELNNQGIKLEKEGRIGEAIKIYEQNIAGEKPYPARHSFDRLMILYRKLKDIENEIRVINKAIQIFPHETKYKERLSKAIAIQNKRNNN